MGILENKINDKAGEMDKGVFMMVSPNTKENTVIVMDQLGYSLTEVRNVPKKKRNVMGLSMPPIGLRFEKPPLSDPIREEIEETTGENDNIARIVILSPPKEIIGAFMKEGFNHKNMIVLSFLEKDLGEGDQE